MDLDREEIILLIQEYEKRRVLWDAQDKWHFNKNKKNDAWREISEELNIDVEKAKKKMCSLLGSFRREKSKDKKSVGTGRGASEVYKSNWFAFKSFSFLVDKDEPKETINSEQSQESNDESRDTANSPQSQEPNDHQTNGEGENDSELPTMHSDSIIEQQKTKRFIKPSTPKRKRMKKTSCNNEKEDPRIEMAYKFLQQPTEEDDSTTKYAKYLAGKLKQFCARRRAILIHQINTLVFEAEMDMFPDSDNFQELPSRSSPSPSPPPTYNSSTHTSFYEEQEVDVIEVDDEENPYFT